MWSSPVRLSAATFTSRLLSEIAIVIRSGRGGFTLRRFIAMIDAKQPRRARIPYFGRMIGSVDLPSPTADNRPIPATLVASGDGHRLVLACHTSEDAQRGIGEISRRVGS